MECCHGDDHSHKEDVGNKYTCPMHPEIVRDKPGMCPECGMALVPGGKTKHKNGNDKHAGHSTAMFLRKFWVSLALTIPVVIYSDIAQKIFRWSPPEFFGSEYLPLILSSIVFFYGGLIFLSGAWREIKGRAPGMMTLIGLATSAAYIWSVYAVFAGVEALFWELTTLITVMLLGHFIEMRAVSGAQGALKELSKLLPDSAELQVGGETKTVPLSSLKEGDMILVRPGAKIPADGVIVDGESDVNESMITGESNPVSKAEKDSVIAGTINGDGVLKIQITNIGEKTFLAGIMRLVSEAQASKSRLQILSDRAAFYLTVVALIGGTITLLAWLLAGAEVGFAVARLVAVLVIACPHALGLAVPLVASISTTKAAQNGFLVKQRIALEAARTVDTVLFDKTGTLTKGEFGVVKMIGKDETEILKLAASANINSEHSIAKAIVSEARARNLSIEEPDKFKVIKGKGVRAEIGGTVVLVGNRTLMKENNVSITEEAQELEREGKTVVWLASKSLTDDRGFVRHGIIALADVIREESREAIEILRSMGIKTAMITGDSEDVAGWVSNELGIDEYFARVLPEEKSNRVKDLQSQGRKVAMVGDGINDAPALAQADLGIAIGAGTNVAIESAGIILVRDDPRDIAKVIKLSQITYSKMIQNLWWAAGYNIVALPLAAGALFFAGILLQPAVAAVLMSLSTIIVAFNAALMKKTKLS